MRLGDLVFFGEPQILVLDGSRAACTSRRSHVHAIWLVH
jgi:hypothetical protein